VPEYAVTSALADMARRRPARGVEARAARLLLNDYVAVANERQRPLTQHGGRETRCC